MAVGAVEEETEDAMKEEFAAAENSTDRDRAPAIDAAPSGRIRAAVRLRSLWLAIDSAAFGTEALNADGRAADGDTIDEQDAVVTFRYRMPPIRPVSARANASAAAASQPLAPLMSIAVRLLIPAFAG